MWTCECSLLYIYMLYICYKYDIYIKVLYEKYGLRISMQHQALDHNCILDWPQCPRLGAFQRHVDVSSETGTPCNSSLGRPSSDHLKEMLKKNGQPLCCCHISCILKASSSNPTQSTPYHLLSSTSFMSTFQPFELLPTAFSTTRAFVKFMPQKC